jgi:hypothetical protein
MKEPFRGYMQKTLRVADGEGVLPLGVLQTVRQASRSPSLPYSSSSLPVPYHLAVPLGTNNNKGFEALGCAGHDGQQDVQLDVPLAYMQYRTASFPPLPQVKAWM